MPQKKPLVTRNTRHVDGIKEMIDIVRHQQVPSVHDVSGSDLKLQRRVPLPGISSGGSSDQPTRLRDDRNEFGDDSDTDLDREMTLPCRLTPSPPLLTRNNSVLSCQQQLSRSLDTKTLSGMNAAPPNRRMSLQDPATIKRSVRTLPPVQPINTKRCRPAAPVPHLDLSKVIAVTPDNQSDDDDQDTQRSLYSPDRLSLGLEENLYGEETECVIDSR